MFDELMNMYFKTKLHIPLYTSIAATDGMGIGTAACGEHVCITLCCNPEKIAQQNYLLQWQLPFWDYVTKCILSDLGYQA